MSDIADQQLTLLNSLLKQLASSNRFYAPILKEARLDSGVESLEQFAKQMPLTTKQQLVDDQIENPPYGTNLTFPLEQYSRYCQTSGTTGRPLRWLDTQESWQWMLDNWKQVFAASDVTASDVVFCAFSFGPFLGFWSAFEAAAQLHCLCIPGGGMSSTARLQAMLQNNVTVLCCTPTYAMHLGRVAADQGIDLSQSAVRAIIVAGEPGGSLPSTRRSIEAAWPTARVYDHHGMTEIGPASFEPKDKPGNLQIIEPGFIAEIIDPQTHAPLPAGEKGELVISSLGRVGSPLLRYRTGDIVQRMVGDDRFILEGGILARADDMLLVRGVNIYPAAVDQIVRQYNQVNEYQVHVDQSAQLTQLAMTIEPARDAGDPAALCKQVQQSLRDAFSLRIAVTAAKPGELPRFELKAKRWIRK